MAHVVVVGGGPAGSAVALFAARRGHTVTAVCGTIDPPHARQGHTFLALATRILRSEAGDVLRALTARGAIEVPLVHSPCESNLLMRRSVFEDALRQAVAVEPGITALHRASVNRLIGGRDARGVPRVRGVLTSEGVIEADAVVDATGRASRAPRWLHALGAARQPAIDRYKPGLVYITRHYQLRPGQLFPSTRVPLVIALEYATVLAFPEDSGNCQLSVVMAADDPCRRHLLSGAAFDRFLATLPFASPWLDATVALDEPHAMGAVDNRWRRLVDRRGPVVSGLVLAGDAALQTNPTGARGIATALWQARQIAEAIERVDDDATSFTTTVERESATAFATWYRSQVASDAARQSDLRANLDGCSPARHGLLTRIAAAADELREDEVAGPAVERSFNLLAPPGDLFEDPAVLRRIFRHVRARVDTTRSAGPTRAQFERLVTPATGTVGSGVMAEAGARGTA